MTEVEKHLRGATSVLIVEDSPTQREGLAFLLEEAGFHVETASNGKEGLEKVRTTPVELVISDVMMPELDGYGLCSELRKDEQLRQIPVILLTSLADPKDVIRGLESGANNFICKPYEDAALLARIRNVLANQQIRQTSSSEMGIRIFFAGQHFFITADRLQILDLLLSTYENAVNHNSELLKARNDLHHLNERLEARVAERTASLVAEIAARKKIEEERRHLEAQMVQSQRLESVGTLASGVAHEINNPLNVVMNFGQLILDEPGISDQLREYAQGIVSESERMATIVRNLLAFSRQSKETHSPADLGSLVLNTLSLIQAVFRKDHITCHTDISEGLPKVRCRSQQIQQVLMNLLTNARDALNSKFSGPSPEKQITIVLQKVVQEHEQWIRVTVEDSGSGIPKEVAAHIFDPFFTTKPKEKGTGLGLSISYGIVTEHLGRLWFETQQGVGTKFHVDLRVHNGWQQNQVVRED